MLDMLLCSEDTPLFAGADESFALDEFHTPPNSTGI